MMLPSNVLQYLKRVILLFLCTGLFSCRDLFQFNPNEVRLDEEDRNLNEKNIQKIKALPQKDTFRFIVTGDSQRFYDDLADFVDAVNNEPDISFVVVNGDISDFGLSREFAWVSRRLRRLRSPFIGVIGNHDMLANGRLVYKEMFGSENFYFDYNGSRFIYLNTNSREVGNNGTIPDLSWLGAATQLSGHRQGFVFSHVPPFDADFDTRKARAYDSILVRSGKVRLSIHGHQHRYSRSRPYGPGVEYLVVSTVHKRNYALITVSRDSYTIEQKFF